MLDECESQYWSVENSRRVLRCRQWANVESRRHYSSRKRNFFQKPDPFGNEWRGGAATSGMTRQDSKGMVALPKNGNGRAARGLPQVVIHWVIRLTQNYVARFSLNEAGHKREPFNIRSARTEFVPYSGTDEFFICLRAGRISRAVFAAKTTDNAPKSTAL